MILKEIELSLLEIKDLFEYFNKNMYSDSFNPIWSLFIYNNHELLKTPYQQLIQGIYDEKNDPKYLEYCDRMKRIVMQCIDRDEQGNPKFDKNNKPIITEMNVEFNNEIDKLDEEYKSLNEKIKNKYEYNYKFLKQKVKMKICTCDFDEIPFGVPPAIIGIVCKIK